MRKRRIRAPLVAALGILAVLVLPTAGQATGQPTYHSGNPTCEDLGYTTITTFDPIVSATKAGITLVKEDGSHISWTSTVAVDAVIVKGGSGANVYEYPVDTFAGSHLVTPDNSSGGPAGLSHVSFCTDGHAEPGPKPGIEIVKTADKDVAYAGETLNYTLTVTNTGNTVLNGVELSDEQCDTEPVRSGANAGDASFDPGDVWTYTCSKVVPAGVSKVKNVAVVCYESTTPETSVPEDEKCDSDSVETPVERIGIEVVKDAVEPTAVAGTTVHFKISVKNTGTTTFTTYEFTDAACDEVRTGDTSDTSFDPGDVWTYDCAMATKVGDLSADNCAMAKGTDENGRMAQGEDCATVPLTQPATPLAPGGTTPVGTTPGAGITPGAGGTLPETIASGQARLLGPSGCVKHTFRARVRGRSIASVTFYVDGRLVKKFRGTRSTYSIRVKPGRYGVGRHRVVARVRFAAESGTRARTLRLTFRRCAQRVIAPRFTG